MLGRTTSKDPNDYNCRLDRITSDHWNENAFTIRIVSTKPIQVGERLVLKMAGISASQRTLNALWKQLVHTGQPRSLPLPAKNHVKDTCDVESTTRGHWESYNTVNHNE
jgi:hypothetical protein